MIAVTVGIVLVRLFSIYLVITAIQSLSYVVPALFDFASGPPGTSVLAALGSLTVWLGVTMIGLPAFCAWWLWRHAERVLPDEMRGSESVGSASELMLVGVSLLGLYLLVWGVINIARTEAGMATRVSVLDHSAMAQRIPYIVQIVVAIPMLIARQALSELLLKAKFAGTSVERNTE